MLDIILELAAEALNITEEEIDAWREETKEQTEVDYIGNIRQRQIDNPMRSSTPISQQITNSQQHLWNLIEKAEPHIKKALPLLLAISIKRMRIEALEEARTLHQDQRLEDRSAELHRDYTDFCMELDGLGASSSKVRQVKKEEKAILADLVRWKAGDPLFQMADNPWPAIRAMYAGRTMEREVRGQRFGQRSIRGVTPPARKEPWATTYWRFGDDSQTPPAEITPSAVETDGWVGKSEDQAPAASIVLDATVPPSETTSPIYEIAEQLVASLPAAPAPAPASAPALAPAVAVAPAVGAEPFKGAEPTASPASKTSPPTSTHNERRSAPAGARRVGGFANLLTPGRILPRADRSEPDDQP